METVDKLTQTFDKQMSADRETDRQTETETTYDSSRGCHFGVIIYGL